MKEETAYRLPHSSMPEEVQNFLNAIHQPHLDNAQTLYKARQTTSDQHSVSPLTNFVFELFLFNSLYSIDWVTSISDGKLVEFETGRKGLREMGKQRRLLKFCRNRFRNSNASKLSEAFRPLAGLEDLDGNWKDVVVDSRISQQQGADFFRNVAALGLRADRSELVADKATFKLIENCCYFVYMVRNNIFHGQKTLGEIYDPAQSRRVEVYDMFVRCVNSMFFLAVGKKDFGSAYAQLPIIQKLNGGGEIRWGVERVLEMLGGPMGLKPEDSYLHWRLFRDASSLPPQPSGAMFYPSSGRDILFPLILGMPFCTDFYFYEQSRSSAPQPRVALAKIGINRASIEEQAIQDGRCYEFEFDSVRRRIFLMQLDNKDFLDQDVQLSFYMHRGDSNGEGGSDQYWDSSLLPELIAKTSPGQELRVLTDGKPGGLAEFAVPSFKEITPPISSHGDTYYYGTLRRD